MSELMDLLEGSDFSNIMGLTDGFNHTKIDISDIRVDGSNVHIDFEAEGGGDITFRYGGTEYTLDCTTGDGPGGIATVILEQGTDEEPLYQLVYMFYSETSESVEVATSSIIPDDGTFSPVCYCLCPTSTLVDVSGALYIQRISDLTSDGTRGALSHVREKIRLGTGNNRVTGCEVELAITTNAGSRDNVHVTSLPGTFYQLHKHDWAGYASSSYGIRAVGQKIGECTIPNYGMITDLGTITETGIGETITDGDSIYIDIIGIGTSCSCKRLGFMVSKNKWATAADAIDHANQFGNIKYPKDIAHLCFTIARIVLTYASADSGTWTNALSATTNVWHSDVISPATPNYPSNYPNNSAGYLGAALTHSGAVAVRVHFRDFNTEQNYDFVRLRNAGGTNIFSYHGSLGAFTSAALTGDTVRPYFESDGSVQRKGCYIDRFEYLEEIISGGGEIIDMR